MMEAFDQWATPASILIGIIFGAAQVKAAIESLRHAVDRLDQAVRLLETRTQSVEQRIARLEGKAEG
jgi:chaperonin cofactor prefoldin|tara:strand:- start:212 stop:412 length:201 start_codon:yes stop_codon:yes gene_type:complete